MKNTLEKSSPIIFIQDSLNSYLAHYEVNDFDEDGYNAEVNNQVDTSYLKTIPLLIEKSKPSPSPPIVSLLEPSSDLKLKPFFDAPTDTLPVIPNQEDQLIGILKAHKEVVGWDITDMRNNNFMNIFFVFGTTFKDSLHNLSTILK